MTVGDLRKLIEVLPDDFAVRMDCKSDTQEHVRNVSLEQGALVLRQHMLTVHTVVDTFTAHDGVEYVITRERVHYPTIIEMNVNHQIRASLKRLNVEQ